MRPTVMDAACEGDVHEGSPLRALWLAQQLHPGLVRETVPLARIARNAGADDVFPSSLAAAVAGQYVVEVEFRSVEQNAAVLAGVSVTLEDVVSRELDLFFWQALKETEDDDARYPDSQGDCLEHPGLGIFH